MKPLTACLKKFGKAISSKDAKFINASRKEYIESGIDGEEATNKAISDWIESLDGDLSNLKKEIADAGGHVPGTSYSIKEPTKNKLSWQESGRENGEPNYLGDGYRLDPIMLYDTRTDLLKDQDPPFPLGHAEHVGGNNQAWAFTIRDPKGNDIGNAMLQLDPETDEIIGIHDFYINKKKSGAGEKILEQILANSSAPVKVYEMIDSAWDFWQKMGVEFRHPFNKSGELSYEQYTRAKRDRLAASNAKADPVVSEKEKADKNGGEVSENPSREAEYQLDEKQEKGIEDDWLYRTGGVDENFIPPPKDTNLEKTIRYVQNKFLPLKRVQEAIRNNGKVITDEMNAETKEELMHSMASEDQKEIQNDYVKKIVDALNKYKISEEELDLFLYSKHAKERNKFIAERRLDPQLKLLKGEDSSKWEDGGSGMTNKQAKDNLKAFQNEGKLNELEEIADVVYAMLKNKSDRLNKFGLLSDAQQKSWDGMFEFYVSLKGFQDDGGDTETAYVGKIGKGFNIQGKESMHSLGRRTMSASPLATSITDSMAAIMRSRKNEVGQSFLRLVRDNPNQEYWTIHTRNNPGTREQLNKKTGLVDKIPLSFHDMVKSEEHLGIKIKGEQVYVRMSDPRLAKAMKNMGADTANGVIKFMGGLTRILSALNTSLNLEFIISNGFRDPLTAVFNALAETEIKGGKLRGKFKNKKEKAAFAARIGNPKNIFSAIRAINSVIKNKDTKGEMQDYFREFRAIGAETGYFDSKSFPEQEKEIHNMLKMAKGGIEGNLRKYSKSVFDTIDRLNTSVENGVRLTAYIEARNAGLSKQQAGSFSKNLTVNFNRKGEITWLNAIYMFGNASVQGTSQFLRSIASNPMNHPSGKTKLTLAQKAAVTMSMSGYVFAMLGREMGGEDDDGESFFDKVPDHVLERNIVIMKSTFGGKEDGTFWKIPLPYGYNVFHNIGTALESVKNGHSDKNMSWATRFLAFSALGSFSPIGVNESKKGVETGLFKTVTPTLFKPFIEMAVDENFFGNHIFRNSTFDQYTVLDSTGKQNTPAHWKFVSKFLNDITGGDSFKKEAGLIDIAPESFKHLLTSYAGGLGRLGDNTLGLVGDLVAGNEIEGRNIPFYRKVSGKSSNYSDTNDFYNRKDDIYRVHDVLKSMKGRDKIIYRRENKENIGLYSIARATEKRLRSLRKQRKAIENGNHTNKKIHLERVQEKMDQTVTRFNLKYNQLFN